MNTQRNAGWLMCSVVSLLIGLAGCASDSSTPVGGSGDVTDVFDISGDMDITVGLAMGGRPEGLTFRVKGSSSGTNYYWTVSGNLPPGVEAVPTDNPTLTFTPGAYEAIANEFTLRGAPTACGNYPLTIQVHNETHSVFLINPTAITLVVQGTAQTCGPPVITTSALTFLVDAQLSRAVQVTGGVSPFMWSVTGLSAVPGLSFDTTSGVFSGIPTAAGTANVTVRVTDNVNRTSPPQVVTIEVRPYRLQDFTGTWSGVITSGSRPVTGGGSESLVGQRLSLSLGVPTTVVDQANRTIQTDPITQGTLGALILNPVPTGLTLEPSFAEYSGLFNGPIPQLDWHFTCDPNAAGDLICIGHHSSGVQFNTTVLLSRVTDTFEDDTAPVLASSVPVNGALNVTALQVTVVFSEPMSGSGTAALSTGGTVGPITFTDLTTAVIPIATISSSTLYTLTLNPGGATGANRFMDLAGNTLPQTTIAFTTGIVTPATLTLNKTGSTGSGSVTSSPIALSCGEAASTCSADFPQGTAVTLTADPSDTSTFSGWSGSGLACPGTASCTVTLTGNRTITAMFTALPTYPLTVNISGSGSVGSVTPGWEDCSSPTLCSGTFIDGTVVTLTPLPEDGFTFSGWSGACMGTADCTVTMTAARTATATFVALPTYTVSVTTVGSGTVTSTAPSALIACGLVCSADFPSGTQVELTAQAAGGFTFIGWSDACSGAATCILTVDGNKAVTATFSPLATYMLTVTLVGNGTVSASVGGAPASLPCSGATCTGSFASGTTVTLTAQANSGSSFAGWSGASCAGTASCNVTMDAAKTITATFNVLPNYVLTVSLVGNGTVSASVGGAPASLPCSGATCTGSFASGTTVTLTAQANSGSSFAGWSGASCSGTASCNVTIDADKTVTATFSTLPSYTLTVTLAGTGSGSVASNPLGLTCNGSTSGSTCTGSFVSGTTVVLTGSPIGNSSFAGWGSPCSGTSTCSVLMDGAKGITATFTTLPSYVLTVTLGGTGTGTVAATVGGSSASLPCSGSTCTGSFVSGTTVTLTAAPTSGDTFGGWSGAGCSGTGVCSITMSSAQNVTATFTVPTSGLVANPQTFTFRKRQQTDSVITYRYMVTLTGSAPGGGPVTFRITRYPSFQDPLHGHGVVANQTYKFVDPNTAVVTAGHVATASEVSTVAVPPGDGTVGGAPIFVYSPRICHTFFAEDSFEFVTVDSQGNESAPATVRMISTTSQCNH